MKNWKINFYIFEFYIFDFYIFEIYIFDFYIFEIYIFEFYIFESYIFDFTFSNIPGGAKKSSGVWFTKAKKLYELRRSNKRSCIHERLT